MSSRSAHILQARHNEGLARELAGSGYRYRDWAVISAFYAAVHYFEARLHDDPPFTHPQVNTRIYHTDAIPGAVASGLNRSPHQWRSELLRFNSNREVRRAYLRIRIASETARYHSHIDTPIRTTAHDYFTDQVVDRFLSIYLETIKEDLGVS